MKPENVIMRRVEKSTDEHLSKFDRSRESLRLISFSDCMDIVLYMFSLQKDLGKLAQIRPHVYMSLIVGKEWTNDTAMMEIIRLSSPWSPGPGPMGGTMGEAEHYTVLDPGMSQHRTMLEFFRYPEELEDKWEAGNWPFYKKHHIERCTFPKFRRQYNKKKMESILKFSAKILKKLRENKKD